jgi:hypothetical protein
MRDLPGTKKFIVGPCCPLSGKCPGNDAHFTHTEVDFDYPTYSGLGTQYGQQIELIWLKDDPDNMMLDNSKIAWKALWQFIIRLKSHCTDDRRKYQIVIHEEIKDLIDSHLLWKEKAEFNAIVTPDTKRNFNHHTHMHLKIGLKG